jgi:hypothetical protein
MTFCTTCEAAWLSHGRLALRWRRVPAVECAPGPLQVTATQQHLPEFSQPRHDRWLARHSRLRAPPSDAIHFMAGWHGLGARVQPPTLKLGPTSRAPTAIKIRPIKIYGNSQAGGGYDATSHRRGDGPGIIGFVLVAVVTS